MRNNRFEKSKKTWLPQHAKLERKSHHLLCEGNFKEALENISVAISKNWLEPEYYIRKCQIQIKMKKLNDALLTLEEMKEFCEDNEGSKFQRGIVLSKLERTTEAQQIFESLIEKTEGIIFYRIWFYDTKLKNSCDEITVLEEILQFFKDIEFEEQITKLFLEEEDFKDIKKLILMCLKDDELKKRLLTDEKHLKIISTLRKCISTPHFDENEKLEDKTEKRIVEKEDNVGVDRNVNIGESGLHFLMSSLKSLMSGNPSTLEEEYFRLKVDDLLYYSPSFKFWSCNILDFGDIIGQVPFYDVGRKKEYMEQFFPVEYFHAQKVDIEKREVVLVDVKKDSILEEFLDKIRTEVDINSKVPRNKLTMDQLVEHVNEFFGFGVDSIQVEKRIKELKVKANSNVICLGDLKGFGVCRHRSVLFKVLCDHLGIKCRLIRGYYKRNVHAWNMVEIFTNGGVEIFVVDVTKKNGEGRYVLPKKATNYRSILFSREEFLVFQTQKKKKLIGKGSHGKVYSCSYNNMQLALKKINLKKLKIEKKDSYVDNELFVMKVLSHGNLISLKDYFTCKSGKLNIVMDKYQMNALQYLHVHMRKCELSKWEKKNEVLRLLLKVSKAVRFLHFSKFIHRDIKPTNILINVDERGLLYDVKLCDFGTSFDFNFEKSPSTLVGSKSFVAPEILCCRNNRERLSYGFEIDSYSFGRVMETFLPHLDVKLNGLMKRCMAGKEKSKKRPNFNEIVNKLGDVLIHNLYKEKRMKVHKKIESGGSQVSDDSINLLDENDKWVKYGNIYAVHVGDQLLIEPIEARSGGMYIRNFIFCNNFEVEMKIIFKMRRRYIGLGYLNPKTQRVGFDIQIGKFDESSKVSPLCLSFIGHSNRGKGEEFVKFMYKENDSLVKDLIFKKEFAPEIFFDHSDFSIHSLNLKVVVRKKNFVEIFSKKNSKMDYSLLFRREIPSIMLLFHHNIVFHGVCESRAGSHMDVLKLEIRNLK